MKKKVNFYLKSKHVFASDSWIQMNRGKVVGKSCEFEIVMFGRTWFSSCPLRLNLRPTVSIRENGMHAIGGEFHLHLAFLHSHIR